MDNINIVLAANIQKYRKKAGLTQEELADKLGISFKRINIEKSTLKSAFQTVDKAGCFKRSNLLFSLLNSIF